MDRRTGMLALVDRPGEPRVGPRAGFCLMRVLKCGRSCRGSGVPKFHEPRLSLSSVACWFEG